MKEIPFRTITASETGNLNATWHKKSKIYENNNINENKNCRTIKDIDQYIPHKWIVLLVHADWLARRWLYDYIHLQAKSAAQNSKNL